MGISGLESVIYVVRLLMGHGVDRIAKIRLSSNRKSDFLPLEPLVSKHLGYSSK